MIDHKETQKKIKQCRLGKLKPSSITDTKFTNQKFSKTFSNDILKYKGSYIHNELPQNPLTTRSNYPDSHYNKVDSTNGGGFVFTHKRSFSNLVSFENIKNNSFETNQDKSDYLGSSKSRNMNFTEKETFYQKKQSNEIIPESPSHSKKISMLLTYRDKLQMQESQVIQKRIIKNMKPKLNTCKNSSGFETTRGISTEKKDQSSHFFNTKFVESKNYRTIAEQHLINDFFRRSKDNFQSKNQQEPQPEKQEEFFSKCNTVNLNKKNKNLDYGKTIYNNMTSKNLRYNNYRIMFDPKFRSKRDFSNASKFRSESRENDKSGTRHLVSVYNNENNEELLNITTKSKQEKITDIEHLLNYAKPSTVKTCYNFFPRKNSARENIIITDLDNNFQETNNKFCEEKPKLSPCDNKILETEDPELLEPKIQSCQYKFPKKSNYSLQQLKGLYKNQRNQHKDSANKNAITSIFKEYLTEPVFQELDKNNVKNKDRHLSQIKLKQRMHKKINYENFFKSVWNESN